MTAHEQQLNQASDDLRDAAKHLFHHLDRELCWYNLRNAVERYDAARIPPITHIQRRFGVGIHPVMPTNLKELGFDRP